MSFGFGPFFAIFIGLFASLSFKQTKNTHMEILNINNAKAPAAKVIPMMAAREIARVLF
jgi:hypothetical protein